MVCSLEGDRSEFFAAKPALIRQALGQIRPGSDRDVQLGTGSLTPAIGSI
jgi:hypothetical protein